MSKTSGIHHITAIAGDPARNADFYCRVLGLRMIKKTINYDDPGTYHLYYGDHAGNPGTALTFFPWLGARQGARGAAEASSTGFSVPEGSVSYWQKRFTELGVKQGDVETRFGEAFLPFFDPDGMSLAIVEQKQAKSFAGESRADVPASHAIRSFSGITLHSVRVASTAAVLSLLGYEQKATDGRLSRWSTGSAGRATDVDLVDSLGVPLHIAGAGTVHHVAFAAADDVGQAEMVAKIRSRGISVTEQVDRNYFRSVYFREPGGVLFEIATNEPGFSVDEPTESLGESLMLPSWLEPKRAAIQAALPPLPA